MINLVKSDDPILRTFCKPVELFPLDSNLIEEMFSLMSNNNGVGLAAPQIGLDARIFIIKKDNFKGIFVNPKIIQFGNINNNMTEKCLSLPNDIGEVSRPRKIKVEYQDENGNQKKSCFEGLVSRIFQHELDHLNGILFIDKLNK